MSEMLKDFLSGRGLGDGERWCSLCAAGEGERDGRGLSLPLHTGEQGADMVAVLMSWLLQPK